MVNPISKRELVLARQCEEIGRRRRGIEAHREIIKHDASEICRKPITLGGAFVIGGVAAYLFHPSGERAANLKSDSTPVKSAKGPIKVAGELVLIKLVTGLFEQLTSYLQRKDVGQ